MVSTTSAAATSRLKTWLVVGPGPGSDRTDSSCRDAAKNGGPEFFGTAFVLLSRADRIRTCDNLTPSWIDLYIDGPTRTQHTAADQALSPGSVQVNPPSVEPSRDTLEHRLLHADPPKAPRTTPMHPLRKVSEPPTRHGLVPRQRAHPAEGTTLQPTRPASELWLRPIARKLGRDREERSRLPIGSVAAGTDVLSWAIDIVRTTWGPITFRGSRRRTHR